MSVAQLIETLHNICEVEFGLGMYLHVWVLFPYPDDTFKGT